MNLIRRVTSHGLFWPIFSLVLIMLFNLIVSPRFFKLEIKEGHLFGSLVDILNRGAPLMLLAVGMTFVIATKGVDLSVGAVIAISAAIAASLIGGVTGVTNTPLPLVILITLVASILCGLWNGFLVSRFGIQPVVATLVLMLSGRGVAQLITEGQILTIYYDPFIQIGTGFFLGLPIPIYIVLVVTIAAALLARRTALGLFIESVGTNASASLHSGINEKNVKLFAYVFCALCAGVAGLIISSNIKSADANNAGLLTELDAILAVVIGGTSMAGGRFTLAGSLVGALIIQSLTTTIYSLGVPPEVVKVVKALVVLAVCLIQSDALRVMVSTQFGSKRKGALP